MPTFPKPFTCGIINAKSGRCPEDCAFCAQSARYDTGVSAYPLKSGVELFRRAEALAAAGVDYMGIVISGATPTGPDLERICRTAAEVTARLPIRLCASLGLLSKDQAAALKEAGFTSYHHNLETGRSYYPRVCTSHSYTLRLETVKTALAAGFRVCSGGIFGLGEPWADRLELARTLADLGVHSIPINFLTPIKGTPLEGAAGLGPAEALAVIALFRALNKDKDIVVCGGRSRTLGREERSLFAAGANGLMVGDYLTTKGGPLERDMEMLKELGLR